MICTEKEAKKKRCPLDRDYGCMGSACVCWVWTGKCKTGVKLTDGSKHGPTELGFCGLASGQRKS